MTSFRAKSSISSVHLFPGIFLLQPPEQGKGQSRKSKCQLMPDIRTLLSDESSNWSSVPSNLHSQGSAEEPEAESANGTPSKRQKILIAPRIKIIVTPSCSPEDEMFFRHHNNVNDSPVSDDTQEGLESSLREESRSATTDDDCGDEPKCDENNARDAKSPRTEVLCMHGERIVVWDVVLCNGSVNGRLGRTMNGTYGNGTKSCQHHEEFAKTTRGLKSHLQWAADSECQICMFPGSIGFGTGI